MKNPMIYINNSIKKFGIKLRYGNRVRRDGFKVLNEFVLKLKKRVL